MKPFVFPPTFAELLLKSIRPQAHGRPAHTVLAWKSSLKQNRVHTNVEPIKLFEDNPRCKKPARGLFNDSFDANAESSQAATQVAMSINYREIIRLRHLHRQ
jgi:hypothetical protein